VKLVCAPAMEHGQTARAYRGSVLMVSMYGFELDLSEKEFIDGIIRYPESSESSTGVVFSYHALCMVVICLRSYYSRSLFHHLRKITK
jgi:hypothetical protein